MLQRIRIDEIELTVDSLKNVSEVKRTEIQIKTE